MVKILLKKQMTEIFRSYFYNPKKNTKRATSTSVLYIVLFSLLILAIFGGIFGYLAYSMCPALSSINLGWMYFLIMGLLAIALGAFGSVFNTYAGLYLAKDNDLLLSLPIPVAAIMVSRLLGVYLMGLMYSGIVSLSAVVVYLIVTGFTFRTLICGLLYVFIISVIVLLLSCLLGWVVAKLSQKLKNKSFVTVFISLVGLGLYYFCFYRAQDVLTNIIANAVTYGNNLKGSVYFLYTFGRIAEGSWLATLAWLAAVGVLFALTWLLLQRSFLRVATGTGTSSSSKKKTGSTQLALRPRSVRSALFAKELGRLTSSAGYMLNCSMGTLFLVILSLALIIKADFLQSLLAQMSLPGDAFVLFIICAVGIASATNDMAQPSVSLEGKNIWILQTLPVTGWEVIKAKFSVQLVLTLPFTIMCFVVSSLVLGLSAVHFILGIVFVTGFVLLMALFDLFLGLKLPNLTWTNELTPIKQSFGIFIAMFAGWVYMGIIICLYLFFGDYLSDSLLLTVFSALNCMLCVVLSNWLRKKGSEIFSRL
jgi:ABC-2 type transport system permease protein